MFYFLISLSPIVKFQQKVSFFVTCSRQKYNLFLYTFFFFANFNNVI